jgi:hypothetical protein
MPLRWITRLAALAMVIMAGFTTSHNPLTTRNNPGLANSMARPEPVLGEREAAR